MAQLVEQRIRNAQVVGSSPTISSTSPPFNNWGAVFNYTENSKAAHSYDCPQGSLCRAVGSSPTISSTSPPFNNWGAVLNCTENSKAAHSYDCPQGSLCRAVGSSPTISSTSPPFNNWGAVLITRKTAKRRIRMTARRAVYAESSVRVRLSAPHRPPLIIGGRFYFPESFKSQKPGDCPLPLCDQLSAAHIRRQRLGNSNGSVGVKVVFKKSNKHSRRSYNGIVKRVREILAAILVLYSYG